MPLQIIVGAQWGMRAKVVLWTGSLPMQILAPAIMAAIMPVTRFTVGPRIFKLQPAPIRYHPPAGSLCAGQRMVINPRTLFEEMDMLNHRTSPLHLTACVFPMPPISSPLPPGTG